MNQETGGSGVVTLLMFIVWCAVISVLSHFLAKEKGRNVALWTVLGAIPFVNFIAIWYFVGAANFRLERKVDQILETLGKR